jgi:SAM-dependent methyltransferase
VLPEPLRELTRCPSCGGDLSENGELSCSGCSREYEVVDGIPLLADVGGGAPSDRLKRRQLEFFDHEADPEYETVRPHGTPAFHRWLLEEKFRRATSELRQVIDGGSVLVTCGGSGMDAELLERAGARLVVCSDLSLNAARRARERARRFGLRLVPVVADAEALPFADRSFDLVYVHDGLHHLEDPAVGLREMARVARVAVSVNEPAQARATSAAVRVGLSVDYEEAGNRVERMTIEGVGEVLRDSGFEVRAAERYAMLYRHRAGLPARTLSAPGVGGLARGLWRAGNAVIGAAGNKLTVQGFRLAA